MKTYSKEAISLKVLIFILVLIPFLAQLVALPLVNKMHPIILGFPLLHFWLLIWMVLTPLFTWAVFHIQKTRGELD
ncbi:DUF3311 domain-containing protein [Neobacillus sp. PS3-40]|uniref:DUF3311 domain-containing protein n=1 Tax=Neobacillus sp. PS3-40 TaxID=3070679 RepID=UPI0027DEC82A|nr:DUF3311 domain-containing protein [Neobacillus sp. PS3-40]WML43023.1 DUF3311 domain-containing protein [Neobacillus sp. PS3-40]